MSSKSRKETAASLPRMESAAKNGGFVFTDPQQLKDQRGVLWSMAKQVGANLTSGKKDVVNVSLPIRIFEPRSYLQRLADGWWAAPIYLSKAAAQTDPVERLKYVITFAIAGLHNTCTMKKPFNPILGETYQAVFDDGTQIFCEQSSHHPPISNWEVIGPDHAYYFHGSGEWTASFRGNSIKGHQKGTHTVEFKDGTIITYNLPKMWVRGMLWGDRIMDYEGTMTFEDKKHNLVANIVINPASGSGFLGFFKGSKHPSDYLEGNIERISQDEHGKEKREVVSHADGTWLGCLRFDEQFYWDYTQQPPISKPKPVDHPLPSDSSRREDLIHLLAGDQEQAQHWKHILEQKQRAEEKARKEADKARKKADKAALKSSRKKQRDGGAAAASDEQPN